MSPDTLTPVNTKPQKRMEIPGRYLLLLVSALCIAMIILTYSTDILSDPLSRFVGITIVPIQNGVSKAGTWVLDRQQISRDIASLREENAQLKAENEDLSFQIEAFAEEKNELEQLRLLYALDSRIPGFSKTGARVIARDTGNWYHSFIIDKGKKDGLDTDMNVLAGSGLAGRITLIGENWAQVESIIDDDSSVAGMVEGTQQQMIVNGDLTLYDDGVISFTRLLDPDDRVKEGARVVTSNISDKYLPGILIGYVSSIEQDPNRLTKSGTITPAVDFGKINNVLVVLEKKQTVD